MLEVGTPGAERSLLRGPGRVSADAGGDRFDPAPALARLVAGQFAAVVLIAVRGGEKADGADDAGFLKLTADREPRGDILDLIDPAAFARLPVHVLDRAIVAAQHQIDARVQHEGGFGNAAMERKPIRLLNSEDRLARVERFEGVLNPVANDAHILLPVIRLG